nr:Dihydrofolate reductase [uncultured bacterium]
MISIIAAIDEKRGLGKNNDLLFKIPGDMQRLRTLTTGHPLVMGRKTFASLGRLLPNRTHIVITRDPESLKNLSYQPEVVVSSLEEALEKAKEVSLRGGTTKQSQEHDRDRHAALAMTEENEEVFIFGGGQIFTEAIEKGLVDRLYLTIVKGEYEADTFFPDYSMFTKVVSKEDHEEEGYTYTFLDLEK